MQVSNTTQAFSADISLLGGASIDEATGFGTDFDQASKLTHQVYNFEVSGAHTYIADGIRVHNTSALSFLADNERVLDAGDADGDGDIDWYLASIEGGQGTVLVTTATTSGEGGTGDTVNVKKDYVIDRDGDNNIELTVETIYELDENGEESLVTSDITSANLNGSRIGGELLSSLTPFLSRALIGDDASLFENVVADTVIDTLLDNVGQVIGGIVEIETSFLSEITGANADGQSVLGQLSEQVFEDLGGQLALAGTENVVSAVSNLILAEIFEAVEVGGIGGAILETVTGTGLNVLVSNGVDHLLDNLFDALPNDTVLGALPGNYNGQSFEQAFQHPVSLIVTAVLNEILPALETLEGQIASAITTAAVTLFSNLSTAVAGPVGAVLGFVVGAIFDSLFEKHPQAWTNVGFNEETGRFEIIGTWEDDGGNTELSETIAQSYLDAMNGFVDAIMAESHNYSELAQWSFGHYDEHIKNAGRNGQTFQDAQDAYLDAYLHDLADAQLNDGQMTAVRALQDVPEVLAEFTISQMIGRHTNVFNSIDHARPGVFAYQANDFLDYDPIRGNPPSISFRGLLQNVVNLAEQDIGHTTASFYRFQSSHFDEIIEVTYLNTYSESQFQVIANIFRAQLETSDFRSYEEYFSEFGTTEQQTLQSIQQLIAADLQIAHDYHTYLENTAEINAIIAAAPDSAFAAGWVATLLQAEQLGLNDNYELTGDAIDNVFYTADGDDSVSGENGHDLIKTYGGDDILRGGNGEDELHAGSGDDTVYGGNNNDSLYGGAGIDRLDGGNGDDYLTAGGNTGGNAQFLYGRNGDDTYGVWADDGYTAIWNETATGGNDTVLFHDLNVEDFISIRQHSSIVDGAVFAADGLNLHFNTVSNIEAFEFADGTVIENLSFAENGEVALSGTVNNDLLVGADGNETLSGLAGNDVLLGQAGDDRLNGGNGHDALYGGDGRDRLYGGNGNDYLTAGGNAGSSSAQYLYGQNGDDTYGVWANDGFTAIWNETATGGNDTVLFHDLNVEDFTSIRQHSSIVDGAVFAADGLNLHFNTVSNIEAFEFADGTVIENLSFAENGEVTLSGTVNNDLLIGGDVNESLYGGIGDDVLLGEAGADILFGGLGVDQLFGGDGIDRAQYSNATSAVLVDLQDVSLNTGEAAGDTFDSIENLHGSAHNDSLRGDADDNTIWGGNGHDIVYGRNGDDILVGGNGEDSVYGGNGSDQLDGGNRNDYLHGGNGSDTIKGGNGDDLLRGGNGDDLFYGGADADRFRFYSDEEHDVIKDFEDNVDTIQFAGTGFDGLFENWAELQEYATEKRGDVIFNFDENSSVTVENVGLADLEDDIQFL